MRRLALMVGIGFTVTALVAATGSAKLSPVEQKWVQPVIKLFNTVDADLRLVGKQELAPDALIGQSGKNFVALNKTLVALADCPQVLSKAGKPPTTRLDAFAADAKNACVYIEAGALDVAHAIGEIDQGNGPDARAALVSATTEFSDGSDLLVVALERLKTVGGVSPLES
jgi:hypothetical protein